jgi:AP-2 complex subunit alpha
LSSPRLRCRDRSLVPQEKNIGVLTSVSSLVLGVLQHDTAGWDACAPKAARTLTRLVLNKDYSNDYLYYGIPTPWLQIKLLRMLQFFPPPEEHALKMRVSEVLQRIVTGTDVTKNVNKNNVTHAVLFEAINLVIHLGDCRGIRTASAACMPLCD